jgi:hypothetical protein
MYHHTNWTSFQVNPDEVHLCCSTRIPERKGSNNRLESLLHVVVPERQPNDRSKAQLVDLLESLLDLVSSERRGDNLVRSHIKLSVYSGLSPRLVWQGSPGGARGGWESLRSIVNELVLPPLRPVVDTPLLFCNHLRSFSETCREAEKWLANSSAGDSGSLLQANLLFFVGGNPTRPSFDDLEELPDVWISDAMGTEQREEGEGKEAGGKDALERWWPTKVEKLSEYLYKQRPRDHRLQCTFLITPDANPSPYKSLYNEVEFPGARSSLIVRFVTPVCPAGRTLQEMSDSVLPTNSQHPLVPYLIKVELKLVRGPEICNLKDSFTGAISDAHSWTLDGARYGSLHLRHFELSRRPSSPLLFPHLGDDNYRGPMLCKIQWTIWNQTRETPLFSSGALSLPLQPPQPPHSVCVRHRGGKKATTGTGVSSLRSAAVFYALATRRLSVTPCDNEKAINTTKTIVAALAPDPRLSVQCACAILKATGLPWHLSVVSMEYVVCFKEVDTQAMLEASNFRPIHDCLSCLCEDLKFRNFLGINKTIRNPDLPTDVAAAAAASSASSASCRDPEDVFKHAGVVWNVLDSLRGISGVCTGLNSHWCAANSREVHSKNEDEAIWHSEDFRPSPPNSPRPKRRNPIWDKHPLKTLFSLT